MTSQLTTFIARRWSVPESCLEVALQPLPAGLESTVSRARITTHGSGSGIPPDVVVKQLSAGSAREADVYQALWQHLERPPAVQMFGRDVAGGATFLYLEYATAVSPWPWADTVLAARVCEALAQLHDSRVLPRETFSWNYEDRLMGSAEETLQVARAARDASDQRVWRRLGDLRRVVGALPRIRRRLLSDRPTVIHGDMHPGNVILRRTGRIIEVLLIDWARARIGSPLEDIASWLHSLGCWEPQARRRHDTLMRAYLQSGRAARLFDSNVRVDYWYASVSNGLSGAIRYHLAVLVDATVTEAARANSRVALIAWERVVRRAAALVSTNLDR
jgi:aminoglycoside phosphotransferase (APT) family kinase protein